MSDRTFAAVVEQLAFDVDENDRAFGSRCSLTNCNDADSDRNSDDGCCIVDVRDNCCCYRICLG